MAYSPSEKAFEKQREKKIDIFKSQDLPNKLEQIEGVFSQNLMNDLIHANIKEMAELQNVIKKDDLNYKLKRGKTYIFK